MVSNSENTCSGSRVEDHAVNPAMLFNENTGRNEVVLAHKKQLTPANDDKISHLLGENTSNTRKEVGNWFRRLEIG